MLRKGSGLETAERNKLGQELKKQIVDQQWVIGTVGFVPILRDHQQQDGQRARPVHLARPQPDAWSRPAVNVLLQVVIAGRRIEPPATRLTSLRVQVSDTVRGGQHAHPATTLPSVRLGARSSGFIGLANR